MARLDAFPKLGRSQGTSPGRIHPTVRYSGRAFKPVGSPRHTRRPCARSGKRGEIDQFADRSSGQCLSALRRIPDDLLEDLNSRVLITRGFTIGGHPATCFQYHVYGRTPGLEIRSSQEGVGSSPTFGNRMAGSRRRGASRALQAARPTPNDRVDGEASSTIFSVEDAQSRACRWFPLRGILMP